MESGDIIWKFFRPGIHFEGIQCRPEAFDENLVLDLSEFHHGSDVRGVVWAEPAEFAYHDVHNVQGVDVEAFEIA